MGRHPPPRWRRSPQLAPQGVDFLVEEGDIQSISEDPDALFWESAIPLVIILASAPFPLILSLTGFYIQ